MHLLCFCWHWPTKSDGRLYHRMKNWTLELSQYFVKKKIWKFAHTVPVDLLIQYIKLLNRRTQKKENWMLWVNIFIVKKKGLQTTWALHQTRWTVAHRLPRHPLKNNTVEMWIQNCLKETSPCHLGLLQRRRSQREGPESHLTGSGVLESQMV